MTIEGQGRPGFVKGNASVELRPDGTDTLVDVRGQVQTGGLIARLGQRLIANVSKMMQDRFFANLQGKL
jgi:carbon monoxide dehydrogenase subunit G